MIDLKESAERLKKILWEKDISVYKLSVETGINQNTYLGFMNRNHELGCVKLAKACQYLGVSMDYIMGIEKEKK